MTQSKTLLTQAPRSSSLFLKIIVELLSKFKRGRLTMILPDGHRLVFGETAEIECDLTVTSSLFFKRTVLFGDIGFGESYVKGEWETSNLTDLIRWMILNWETNAAISGSKASSLMIGSLRWTNRLLHLFRKNDLQGSIKNISAHYDLSNELFKSFLDPTMTYSCADFSSGARSLEEAQKAKFDRLARMAQIKPTDRVLEVGGGWGAFAIYLAKNYGCQVDSITVSKNQFDFFKKQIRDQSLSERVRVHLLDYRNVVGRYHKIVSIEMLEAVGHEGLSKFFRMAERVLEPQGLIALQVIHCADSRYEKLRQSVDWIQKAIFPGSLLPSVGSLVEAARSSSSFQLHTLHSMGEQYVRTLREWREQFNQAMPRLRHLGFDNRFSRTWNYYLSYCEAAFWMRHIGVSQSLLTRPNNLDL